MPKARVLRLFSGIVLLSVLSVPTWSQTEENAQVLKDRKAQPLVRIPPFMPHNFEGPGGCVMRFDITEKGTVENPEAIYCTDGRFATTSVRSVRRWKYNPAIKNGKAVKTENEQVTLTYMASEKGEIRQIEIPKLGDIQVSSLPKAEFFKEPELTVKPKGGLINDKRRKKSDPCCLSFNLNADGVPFLQDYLQCDIPNRARSHLWKRRYTPLTQDGKPVSSGPYRTVIWTHKKKDKAYYGSLFDLFDYCPVPEPKD